MSYAEAALALFAAAGWGFIVALAAVGLGLRVGGMSRWFCKAAMVLAFAAFAILTWATVLMGSPS